MNHASKDGERSCRYRVWRLGGRLLLAKCRGTDDGGSRGRVAVYMFWDVPILRTTMLFCFGGLGMLKFEDETYVLWIESFGKRLKCLYIKFML